MLSYAVTQPWKSPARTTDLQSVPRFFNGLLVDLTILQHASYVQRKGRK